MVKPDAYRYDVFLCHSSIDKEKVRELAIRLKEEGVSYWLDEEQIPPGESITRQIEIGLTNSKWILVILSPAAGSSPWPRAEYSSYLNAEITGSPTKIIPVLLEKTEIDDIPLLLRDKNRVDLTDEKGFKRLVKRVRPFNLANYRAGILDQPIMSGSIYNGNYQIEPSDLLRIELRELDFNFGDPIRAVRSTKTLKINDLVEEVTSADIVLSMKIIFLLGEAGVGKTTTCKWLCHQLAQSMATQSMVPLYIALGEWDPTVDFRDLLDQQVQIGTFDELGKAIQAAGSRLVLFLDGWNEQGADNLKQVKAFLRKRGDVQNAIVVLTSRPVAAVDNIWEGKDIRFFEIRRWTELQLENYFRINKQAELFAQIPKEALNCLRLPLLAFLLVKRLNQDEPLPTFRTVADVFTYVLEQFLESDNKKSRAISQIQANLSGDPKKYLQKLAYQMTKSNVIQTVGETLESILPQEDKDQFKPFLSNLVNSGLIRSSNAIVALDPNANPDELRILKIGFLHQTFQEYLTAQYLLPSNVSDLPPDVSHDAFWREVPIYIIQSFGNSVGQQDSFTQNFLQGNTPDYLTAARLANEINDPGVRQITKERVLEDLNLNIQKPGLYPYAIEAVTALGITGQKALQKNLSDIPLLMRTFARAEAHLVKGSLEDADEIAWRKLGRSIYLLGELGDFWLVEHLSKHLNSVRSLHLLYHIGEAFLTVARIFNLSNENKKIIRSAGSILEELQQSDAVVRSYGSVIVRTCGGEAGNQDARANELENFLYAQTVIARPYYREEFWQRAHGTEVFTEVAAPDFSVDVLMKLFETENVADYNGYKDGGYPQVQSSILKAVLRSCNLNPGTSQNWRPLLEKIFQSNRISENGWACRHLEHLLIKWFNSPKDQRWIKEWKDSGKIGGSRIANVLANVIWLSS